VRISFDVNKDGEVKIRSIFIGRREGMRVGGKIKTGGSDEVYADIVKARLRDKAIENVQRDFSQFLTPGEMN
jgi:hypothetical protein